MAEKIYQPRSAENATELAETLLRPPEKPLSPEERERVLDFDDKLYSIDLKLVAENPLLKQELEGVENVKEIMEKVRPYAKLIYPEFFLTPEGRKLAEDMKLHNLSTADDLKEVKQALRILNGTKFKDKLADDSAQYPESLLIGKILHGRSVPTFETMTIVKNPANLAKKLRLFLAYKDYLKEVARSIKSDESDLEEQAKLTIIRTYQKAVNDEIATLYIDFTSYIQDSGDIALLQILGEKYGQRAAKIYRFIHNKGKVEAARNLDAIRNGASYSEDTGYTPIMSDLADSVDRAGSSEGLIEEAKFSPEEVETLSQVSLDAEGMQSLISTVISEWGLLSSQPLSDFDENRTGRAPDELWQVPIRGKSLATNGIKGYISVSEKFNRPLTQVESPYGAAPTAAHEAKHLEQGENTYRAKGLHVGRDIKGRGYISIREAGAIKAERNAAARLFGRARKSSKTYIKAVEALLDSGTPESVALAFYNQSIEDGPDGNRLEQAKQAANRALRLFRNGGFNTRVLDYMEAEVLLDSTKSLPDEVQQNLYAQAGLNLKDFVALYQYELTPTNTSFKPPVPFEDVAERWLRERYLVGNEG